MIKMVFFDLDGTLINQKLAQNIAIESIYKKYGFGKATNIIVFKKKWDSLTEYYYDLYLNKECTYEEQRVYRIIGLFSFFNVDKNIDAQRAHAIYKEYLTEFENNWIIYDDVSDTLELIKNSGIKIGVITNGDLEQQKLKINKTNISEYIDDVIAGGQNVNPKPSHDLFYIACSRNNINFEEMIYIGDSYETDIIPCQELGIKSMLLNRTFKTIKDQSVNIIYSCSEIIEYINSINHSN